MAAIEAARNDLKRPVGLARVGVLAFGTFVLGTDGYVIAGILPQIAQGTRVPVALAGQLVTIFALAYALGSPLLAVASARMDRRRLLLGALGVFAVANLGASLAPDYGILAVARVLAALGAAAYTPVATVAAVSLVAPQQRGRALATVTAGMTVAILFGVPLGALVGRVFGWRATFGLITGLAVVAATGLIVWLPALPSAPVVRLRTRLTLLADQQVAGLLVVTVLALAGGFSVYTYLLPLLAQAHPSAWQASLLFVSFGAGGMAGNALGGIGADRLGAARTVGVALLALAGILALFSLAERSLLASGGLLFAWGLAGWAVMPPQQHRLLARAGQAAPAALGLNGSAIYLGIALSGGIGGLLLRGGGPTVLPLAAAGLVAASLVVGVLVARRAHTA
ncbi:MAG: MFS transporter [Candidatus Dormibacteria bacterium]